MLIFPAAALGVESARLPPPYRLLSPRRHPPFGNHRTFTARVCLRRLSVGFLMPSTLFATISDWSGQTRSRRCNLRPRSALLVVLLLPVVLQLGGCRRSLPKGSVLRGLVTDPQNQPVSGVEVRVGGRLVGVTDPSGAFSIRRPTEHRVAVSFSALGYVSTTRIYESRATPGNTVIIWPRARVMRVDAAAGGTLTFPGGRITLAPDSFITAGGGRVDGAVDVAMTVVDVTDAQQVASVPGDFTARMRDGSIQPLETFGLFELVAQDARGRQLELAPDRPAGIAIALPPDRRVPRTIGVYRFEERAGRWVEQTWSWTAQEAQATTQVTSMGWWNADDPLQTTCMQVHVRSCHFCSTAAFGLMGASVKLTGESYTGAVSQGMTDNTGMICLPVKRGPGEYVKVEVSHNGMPGNILHMVPTSSLQLDPATQCTSCPITRTHVNAVGFTDPLTSADPLTSQDPRWCISKGTNGNPFAVRWLDDTSHIKFSTTSGLEITLNDKDEQGTLCAQSPGTNPGCDGQPWASAEYRTECFHGYGTYTATIAPPAQTFTGQHKGLVTTFFTFTNNSDDMTLENGVNGHDEIDFEIMGRAPNVSNGIDDPATCNALAGNPNIMVVQTNYFVKGTGNHEIAYCLAFGTYKYQFDWTPTGITWRYHNGSAWQQLRTVSYSAGDGPTQPGRVFMNLWASTSTLAWIDGPFTYQTPLKAVFSDVTVP